MPEVCLFKEQAQRLFDLTNTLCLGLAPLIRKKEHELFLARQKRDWAKTDYDEAAKVKKAIPKYDISDYYEDWISSEGDVKAKTEELKPHAGLCKVASTLNGFILKLDKEKKEYDCVLIRPDGSEAWEEVIEPLEKARELEKLKKKPPVEFVAPVRPWRPLWVEKAEIAVKLIPPPRPREELKDCMCGRFKTETFWDPVDNLIRIAATARGLNRHFYIQEDFTPGPIFKGHLFSKFRISPEDEFRAELEKKPGKEQEKKLRKELERKLREEGVFTTDKKRDDEGDILTPWDGLYMGQFRPRCYCKGVQKKLRDGTLIRNASCYSVGGAEFLLHDALYGWVTGLYEELDRIPRDIVAKYQPKIPNFKEEFYKREKEEPGSGFVWFGIEIAKIMPDEEKKEWYVVKQLMEDWVAGFGPVQASIPVCTHTTGSTVPEELVKKPEPVEIEPTEVELEEIVKEELTDYLRERKEEIE